jgi:hypothetical protein
MYSSKKALMDAVLIIRDKPLPLRPILARLLARSLDARHRAAIAMLDDVVRAADPDMAIAYDLLPGGNQVSRAALARVVAGEVRRDPDLSAPIRELAHELRIYWANLSTGESKVLDEVLREIQDEVGP